MAYLLHQLLRESARKRSYSEAVSLGNQSWSYGEIDALSDRLAVVLHQSGVSKGDRVGICVPKSLSSVVGIFGILKAGCCYVPLDPNAPASRLAYITRDCGIQILLASSGSAPVTQEILSDDTPIKTLVLLDDCQKQDPIPPDRGLKLTLWRDVLGAVPDDLRSPLVIESDLAMILYTSGSTGNPKGVMISHRTVLTFINWSTERFGLTPADRITSHAPLHFDLSTFDIFATVKAGAKIILIPERLSVFPKNLVELLERERITITYLVPSVLSLMVTYGQIEQYRLEHLRTVLFAGEVFPIKYLRKLVHALPNAEFYNLYGPTETNVCTYYRVSPDDVSPTSTSPVPIGVSCENVEVFAVGKNGQRITEAGEEGELWVRGPCVADGYWGDPGKTAEAFLKNPLNSDFKETVYRTGDIVRLAPDGKNWVYRGREDHMIKSRGYRIELAEIENVLYGHAAVREAVAVAVPDELIGNRIRAFVVPLDSLSIDHKDLERHVSDRVPPYMIPEAIEIRTHLPKTSSGKVNRKLLADERLALAVKL